MVKLIHSQRITASVSCETDEEQCMKATLALDMATFIQKQTRQINTSSKHAQHVLHTPMMDVSRPVFSVSKRLEMSAAEGMLPGDCCVLEDAPAPLLERRGDGSGSKADLIFFAAAANLFSCTAICIATEAGFRLAPCTLCSRTRQVGPSEAKIVR